MSNLLSIFILVFPGYTAALVTRFFSGARGQKAAETILQASIYSVISVLIYGFLLDGDCVHLVQIVQVRECPKMEIGAD